MQSKIKYLIIAGLTIIMSSVLIFAEENVFWEDLKGPEYIGKGRVLINSREVIFVASVNGLFRSTNTGKSFDRILSQTDSIYSENIVLSDNDVLLSITTGHISYSFDNGNTWNLKKGPKYDKYRYPRVLKYWMSGSITYQVLDWGRNDTLFYSKNYGISWTGCKNPKLDHDLNIFTDSIGTIAIGYEDAQEVYISKDFGKNWIVKKLKNKERFEIIAANSNDGSYFYHYYEDWHYGYFCVTHDDFETEEILNFDYLNSPRELIFKGDDEIYAINGVMVHSVDGGKTWEQFGAIADYIYNTTWNYSIINDTLYTLNQIYGLQRTSDKGKTWESLNKNGIYSPWIFDMAIAPNGDIWLTNTVLSKSTDLGETWIQMLPDSVICYGLAIDNMYNIFVSSYDGLIVSENAGETWDVRADDIDYIGGKFHHVFRRLIACNDGSLQAIYWNRYGANTYSTNKGHNWINPKSNVLYGTGEHACIYEAPDGSKYIGTEERFMTSGKIGLYKSNDIGETWERVVVDDTLLARGKINTILIDPKSKIGFAHGGYPYVAKTTDGGNNWFLVQKKFFPVGIGTLTLDSAGSIWLVGSAYYSNRRSNVMSRHDMKADTFELFYDDFISNITTVKTHPSGYIFGYGEGTGLYRSLKKYVSVDEQTTPKESYCEISPNPVSSQATIKFWLAAPLNVECSIMDILGNKVAEITFAYYPSGENRIPFSKGELASGIYFVVLNLSDGRRIERKFVIE